LGSLLDPHSPGAQAIAALFTNFLILAAVIFSIVAALVAYGLVRYRVRPGVGEPAQRFGSRRAETTWTTLALLIVIALFAVTLKTMAFVDAPLEPNRAPDLTIVGHQWWWEARYPNGAVTANEIHVPAGQRWLARIESADVIHDFWAPQLARKMDAVPGRSGYIWLEADHAGTYSGACSEFCGMQHAWMHFQVIAEAQTEFSAWLQHQAEPPPQPTGLAAQGARLFEQHKCFDCHTVSVNDAKPRIGPPLTHVASRKLLGGDLPTNAENLRRWIVSPQSIKPGNRMPDSHLTSADIEALTAYMETLR